jgi:dienelactone hydrolase
MENRPADPATLAMKRLRRPLLTLHGAADRAVPVADSEALAAAMKAAGARHHLEIIPDARIHFTSSPNRGNCGRLCRAF